MSTITKFNAVTCNQTRRALEAALRQVSQELGIRISLGRGTYEVSGNEFRMKLTCNTKPSGVATSTFSTISTNSIGSPIIGLGTTFKLRTSNFTIIRVCNNRPKYKFVAQNQNGTKYKFTENGIRAHIANGM